MRENSDPLRSRVAEHVFEEISILIMLFSALEAAGMFASLPAALWLVLVLAFFFGGIRLAGELIGARKIAAAVLLGVMALSAVLLWQLGFGVDALTACAGYLLMLVVHRFPWGRRIFAFAVAGAVILRFTQRGSPPAVLVAAGIFLLLKELTALYGGRFSVQLLPLTLSVALIALAIPAGKKPIDWSFFLRFGDAVVSVVRGTVQEVQYFFASPEGSPGLLFGYGGNGYVGGGLGGNDREELYLGSKSTRSTISIEGEQYGVLDGNRWEELPGGAQPHGLWYAEFLNALAAHGISSQMARTFSEVRVCVLRYGFLKTNDVLHPEWTLFLSDDVESALTDNPNDFAYRETKGRDYGYSARFMDFDLSNPYLIELLETAEPVEADRLLSYEELADLSRGYYQLNLRLVVTPEEYESYVRQRRAAEEAGAPDPMIADTLDETLSTAGMTDRVRELALSVTEGLESDYDKAKAIETFLRAYPYDAQTDLGETEDFIDAFLFEEKKGYCVHYASAMVMMLRMNGIPARLTEGYRYSYETEKDLHGRYPVKGSSAHLWPEAYIAGFGWVRFEPTANMPDADAFGWGLRVSEEAGGGAGGTGPAPTAAPDRGGFSGPTPEELAAEEERLAAEEAAKQEAAERQRKLAALLAAVPVLAGLALLGLFLAERKFVYRFRGGRARLKASLDDLRWLVRRMYPGDWKNRPLLDYAHALEDRALRMQAEESFLLWYRLRYRGVEPAPEEWARLTASVRQVYGAYLNRAGAHRRRAQILAFLGCQTGLSARARRGKETAPRAK